MAGTPSTKRVLSFASPPLVVARRHVHVAQALLDRFCDVAERNGDLETLGLLYASLSDRYRIVNIILPPQQTTTCACIQSFSEHVLAYIEEESLVEIGWVHTHPTHGTLPSSIDLHTMAVRERQNSHDVTIIVAGRGSARSIHCWTLTDAAVVELEQCTQSPSLGHDNHEPVGRLVVVDDAVEFDDGRVSGWQVTDMRKVDYDTSDCSTSDSS